MRRTQYLLPASGNAPLAISATQASRLVEVMEDGASPQQGIVLYYPKDNFTSGYAYQPAKQPAILGNKVAHGAGRGGILGHPAQVGAAATVLFKAVSMGAATTIDVVEYD